MGDNATPEVPGRSLSTEGCSSSFLCSLKKSTKLWCFYSLLRGKDRTLFTPVSSGLLWEPVFGCGRPEQLLLGTALDQNSEFLNLICFGSQTIWLKLAALKAPDPDAAEVGQHLCTGQGCTHQKSLGLLSELKVILWLGGVLRFLFIEE